VTQLAREAGAYVIGTGRAADRQKALDFGAQEFVGLDNDALEDVGGVDLVFDVIGGDIQKRSAGLIRAGGTLVTVVGPPEARPADGLAVDFVVESDRAQLSEIVQRVRDGRLRTNIGIVATLDDAVAALNRLSAATGRRSSAFVHKASEATRARKTLDAPTPSLAGPFGSSPAPSGPDHRRVWGTRHGKQKPARQRGTVVRRLRGNATLHRRRDRFGSTSAPMRSRGSRLSRCRACATKR